MNQPDSCFVPGTCTEIAGEPTFAESSVPVDNCSGQGGRYALAFMCIGVGRGSRSWRNGHSGKTL